ncbi:g2300 [Coccomyxa viridis]|uniref:G2300 protein n=1 Tax=Coccomyxa viridis TaxID=1274662 RepID=A0ABP1FQH5_9CHLO
MIVRTPLSVRPSSRPLRKTVPRANPFIGETNDPDRTATRKEEKKKDSAWAEPRNKNPLEKTTLSRQGITAQSKEMKDEGLINDAQEAIQGGTEGAKDAIQDAADKVGDAVKKVTGQD